MPIENRELVTTSNISEEVTRLLPAKTIDFADEPGSRNLRVRKAIQRLTKDRSIGRKEPFPSPHDVGRLVIVEPRARPEKRRDLALVSGPEKVSYHEVTNRRIRPVGLRLHREDAEAHFLEEAFVREGPDASEVFESRENLLLLLSVLESEDGEISVTRHTHEKDGSRISVLNAR